MQKQGTTWHCLAVLAALVSCGVGAFAGAGTDKKEEPKPLQPEVVKAWRDAGADVGWMKDVPPKLSSGYAYWAPFREKGEAGAVPALRYHPDKKGVLAMLPDPGVPFGLDTHCCAMNDAQLKELAGTLVARYC